LSLHATAEDAPVGLTREVRLLTDTTAEVRARGLADGPAGLTAAFDALELVDRSLSLFRQSELTRLNDRGEGCVSKELAHAISLSLDVAAASSGAFDPTVEPLTRAAGHLGGRRREPSAQERKRLLKNVGYRKVALDAPKGCVRMGEGTRLDLGGIAQGYGADLALGALVAKGARTAFVDLGGSSRAVHGETVKVEARDPEDRKRAPWVTFEMESGGLGTTAGGDGRPAHILDPRNGLPAETGVLAATVLARTAAEADALDTAVFVLGPVRGLELLARWGAEGIVLSRDSGRPTVWTTPGFAAAHRLQARPDVTVRE
jgi:FAD:protein FMN transferase